MSKNTYRELDALVSILKRLRDKDGCPWDQEQTHASLAKYAVEEAFEVVEAIDAQDDMRLKDELGDLLLQVVFHANLAQERRAFEMGDVLESVCQKMIRRHPHVFPDASGKRVEVDSAKDVAKNWEALKAKEGKKRVLEGVPAALPALSRAARLGDKASSVGFDWPDAQGVWLKVGEELQELQSVSPGQTSAQEEELGDLLFTLAQWARHQDLDPEQALRKATQKFQKRFATMEETAQAAGQSLAKLSASEKDALWEAAKWSLAKDTDHGTTR